jgi:hypothetical protein
MVRVRWRGKGRATQDAAAPVIQSASLVHLMYCTLG